MGKVEVSNDELWSVRSAARELGRLVEQLHSGEAEKVVLTKRGQMCAVVVSLDDFAAMRSCVRERDLSKAA
jgi:PHD/YefM family antitoxin component YafN of YafNO toxin-antitoxin module